MINFSPVAFHVKRNTRTHPDSHTYTNYSEDSQSYNDDTMDRRHSVSESLTPLQFSEDGHYSTSPCLISCIPGSWVYK